MEPSVDDEYLFGFVESDYYSCRYCYDRPNRRRNGCVVCFGQGWWITYPRLWGYE